MVREKKIKHLLDMTKDELKQFAAEMGEKPFRGKQIFIWLSRGVQNIDEMTDLPKEFREKLQSVSCVGGCVTDDVQQDNRDGTRKILFRCVKDGAAVESVFMKYRYGNTLCISSQVGCRMGCRFCASALGGFIRNLNAGEMFGQVLEAEHLTGERISHVVVMGMGEPFDNYDELSKFLHIIHDPDGRNMSYRNITVSTSGIVPEIYRFAEDFPQVNLAISLHRMTNEGRSKIMPVNRRYPLEELLSAADSYTEKTHRRVTFEYALISGENDTDEDMELLGCKLRGMLCHVNLIPLNEVKETGYIGSERKRAKEIAEYLNAAGIPATVRRELGKNIDGACGQLRLRRQNKGQQAGKNGQFHLARG